MNVAFSDFDAIKKSLTQGELNCADLTQMYLDYIRQGAQVNAFISVFDEQAPGRAMDIDRKRRHHKAGPLAGMVLAIKDNLVMDQGRTTCGSNILQSFTSPYDATVIQKLTDADAIFIGKTNMDEFGMGSSNENSAFGLVRNPHDGQYVPGGSSGGSAAAVAAGFCTAALGSDTGGSIRQPAAFCGLVGLKPTYGRVSRYGLVAFASSLDQIGPLTRSAGDCAELLQVISGHDIRDATSMDEPVPEYASFLRRDVTGLRVGVPGEYFDEGVDAGVQKSVKAAIGFLQQSGAQVVDISLPHTPYAIAAYYIIANAEASANLARFDGARYGFRAKAPSDLEALYVKSRSQGFGAEVKRRIMLGTFVLSSGYYEAYFGKAQKVRTLIRQDFARAFEKADLLLAPTCPTTAFRIGEKLDDPLTMYLSDIFTVSVNLAGLPALSVPCGKDQQGLPIGLQLIGNHLQEGGCLRVADFLQRHYPPSAPSEYIPSAAGKNDKEAL
ncbi:Asp-tRNA(Asn)/Glu-tRNA(Gln) amidotransferase subunit GatA [candidate division KSB1 bacterium]|nr:Asp-tRNA(Asn)/Glu-tRNA(Gln) amidotransferase subunit GatA [candidate division KSB1 bacterium]